MYLNLLPTVVCVKYDSGYWPGKTGKHVKWVCPERNLSSFTSRYKDLNDLNFVSYLRSGTNYKNKEAGRQRWD